MSPRARLNGEGDRAAIQDRILSVATDLFIRQGYKGASFLTIAREVGITHSNIHYYFKTKACLAEAVVEAYVAGITTDFRSIWMTDKSDLLTKFVQSRDWIWRQYVRFNPDGVGGQNWGLLARFVGEADLLTPALRKTIRVTLQSMESFIEAGIDMAIRRGELSDAAPRRALVMQISSLLHTSQHITRIDGSFGRLDELLKWTFQVIQRAYGSAGPTLPWPELPSAPSRPSRPPRQRPVPPTPG